MGEHYFWYHSHGNRGMAYEKVKSIMERSPNMIANGKSGQIRASICKVCGKEGLGRNIKRHIEANHLEEQYLHHCNLCGKICRSRNMLWEHKHKNHSERINWSCFLFPNHFPVWCWFWFISFTTILVSEHGTDYGSTRLVFTLLNYNILDILQTIH